MTGSPARKSIGAPPTVSVLIRSGCSAAQIVASQPPWQSPTRLSLSLSMCATARVDHREVVVDAGVAGGVRGPDPVERVQAAQAGGLDDLDLALALGVVDDAGRVPGLGREDERGDDVAGPRRGEVAQPRDRRVQHDLVGVGPARLAAVGHQLAPAQEVEPGVGTRPGVGPPVQRSADGGGPELGGGVAEARLQRRGAGGCGQRAHG